MLRITLRDLQFRSLRFLVTALGAALVFGVVLVLSGLSVQSRIEAEKTVEGIAADAWITKEGANGPLTSAATFEPEQVVRELEDAGATEVSPVVVVSQTIEAGGQTESVALIGHEPGELGTPPTIDGRPVRSRGQLIRSKRSFAEIGEVVEVGDQRLRVVGSTDNLSVIGLPTLFAHIDDMREAFFFGQPLATAVLVQGEPSTIPDGFQAWTPEDTADDALRPLRPLLSSIDLVTLFLWIAATALMGAVVYLSSLERLRDFAVIKSLGGSTRGIIAGLVIQSVVVALLAAALGMGVSMLMLPQLPLTIEIPAFAYALLPVIAVSAGIVASLGGARKAVKVDPALAFGAAGG